MDYAHYARSFVNGAFVEKTAKTFSISNPATGEKVVDVQEAGAEEVDSAVAAAEKAFPAWSERPPHERAAHLRKLASLMEANTKRLAELDSVCMGVPLAMHGRAVGIAASHLTHSASLAETYLGGTASTSRPGFVNMSLKVPYGVVAGITPWNVPCIMFTAKAGPALAAGNVIIIKTSEKSPLSGSLIAELAAEAGFPPGVLQVITGGGLAGKLIAEHMRIRAISFTGSTRTGRAIQEASARSNLKTVQLELGGKSPAVVCEDADIEQAVKALSFSLWNNSGQICMASTRVYVHEKIREEFVSQYKSALRNITGGDPSSPKTFMGPLADSIQHKAVSNYIETGRKEGKVLLESKASEKGYYVNPMIFSDVADDATINREEIFGPVVVVHTFADDEEAIRRSNNSEYGLFASVFTKNVDRALKFAKRLEAGNVAVNCSSPMGDSNFEFGGVKQSGVGREGGVKALEPWLETKSVYIAVSN